MHSIFSLACTHEIIELIEIDVKYWVTSRMQMYVYTAVKKQKLFITSLNHELFIWLLYKRPALSDFLYFATI